MHYVLLDNSYLYFDISIIHQNSPIKQPVNRKLLKNRFAVEKDTKMIISSHSGVWEMSKVDGR